MMDIRLNSRRAIMRVSLIDRIQAQDFSEAVAPAAERLRARHGRIEFLILDVRRFHGWGPGGTFAAQIRFLRCFGRSVERVAVFGSRAWNGATPAIAALFVAAEVRSFAPGQGWLMRRWMRVRKQPG